MNRKSTLLRLVTAAVAAGSTLLLAGCDVRLDRDQARLCRLTAVALAPEGVEVAIADQRLVSRGEETDVRIETRTGATGEPAAAGFVECSFGVGTERLHVTAVRTEAGLLSEPRVYMLNRFWLNAQEASDSDPLPIANSQDALSLPAGTGYGVQQLVNAIPGAAIYGLMAAAYSLVYGLVGRINLAFGAFAAIGATAALIVVLGEGNRAVGLVLALAGLAAISCAAFHGIATARLVFKPLQGSTGQQGLVATVGLGLFLGEYMRLTQGTEPRWIGPILGAPFALARDPGFVVTITPIAGVVSAVAATAALALLLTMRRSPFGRAWRAFSDDPRAAALFGVSRDRLFAQTFGLASALAGLAGAISVVFFGDVSFSYATTLGLKALAAAIVGGIGSVPGALLGGLFIALVESGWSAAFPIVNRDLVVYCILVGTLMWRPGGFLGFGDLTPRRV